MITLNKTSSCQYSISDLLHAAALQMEYRTGEGNNNFLKTDMEEPSCFTEFGRRLHSKTCRTR